MRKEFDPADPFDGLDDEGLEPRQYAEAFIFENVGDGISGRITEMGVAYSRKHEDGRGHLALTLETPVTLESGTATNRKTDRSVHVIHAVMKSEIAKHNPTIGEHIVIRRLDDRESKAGETYRVYSVELPARPKPSDARDVLRHIGDDADLGEPGEPETGETPLPMPEDDLAF